MKYVAAVFMLIAMGLCWAEAGSGRPIMAAGLFVAAILFGLAAGTLEDDEQKRR